ncbi:Uncharacterised protein [Bordetella pertussis]|nr:Uncharacterised protein [Bordetella pertussis]
MGDTLTGASSMMARMVVSPTLPPCWSIWRMISRKVSMPASIPDSMMTSEPISCSLMVCTATDT